LSRDIPYFFAVMRRTAGRWFAMRFHPIDC
jgi:hypothetical protein